MLQNVTKSSNTCLGFKIIFFAYDLPTPDLLSQQLAFLIETKFNFNRLVAAITAHKHLSTEIR
jgi:hypothetical protein